jgi:hypothetical protein
MKKIVLMIAVLLATISASAQVYVGGGLAFTGTKEDGVKATHVKILPEIGYELNEAWSIGTVIGWQYNKVEDYKVNTFEIAPYARYNFLHSERVNLFVDGGFGYATSKVKHHDSMDLWQVGFKPGISVRLSEHFMFVAKYGFLGYKELNETGYKVKEYGLDLDTDELSFGFHYIF